MAKQTEIEKNLKDEPDQKQTDKKCADLLKATRPQGQGQSSGNNGGSK